MQVGPDTHVNNNKKKKKAIAIQSFLSVDDHVISFVTFYSIEGMTFLLRQRV
jgi:hypothetical protein